MRISDWSSDVCSSDLTYELLFNFPDKRVGWLPAARQRALHLFEEWRPDAILATAPPFTALLIGYLLAKRARIPLIVEFRDRWSDDPYYPPPWWRRRLEHWTEARIVRHAAGLTTVSEPWAETYRARRSEEHTSEHQSLMRISYAVF